MGRGRPGLRGALREWALVALCLLLCLLLSPIGLIASVFMDGDGPEGEWDAHRWWQG